MTRRPPHIGSVESSESYKQHDTTKIVPINQPDTDNVAKDTRKTWTKTKPTARQDKPSHLAAFLAFFVLVGAQWLAWFLFGIYISNTNPFETQKRFFQKAYFCWLVMAALMLLLALREDITYLTFQKGRKLFRRAKDLVQKPSVCWIGIRSLAQQVVTRTRQVQDSVRTSSLREAVKKAVNPKFLISRLFTLGLLALVLLNMHALSGNGFGNGVKPSDTSYGVATATVTSTVTSSAPGIMPGTPVCTGMRPSTTSTLTSTSFSAVVTPVPVIIPNDLLFTIERLEMLIDGAEPGFEHLPNSCAVSIKEPLSEAYEQLEQATAGWINWNYDSGAWQSRRVTLTVISRDVAKLTNLDRPSLFKALRDSQITSPMSGRRYVALEAVQLGNFGVSRGTIDGLHNVVCMDSPSGRPYGRDIPENARIPSGCSPMVTGRGKLLSKDKEAVFVNVEEQTKNLDRLIIEHRDDLASRMLGWSRTSAPAEKLEEFLRLRRLQDELRADGFRLFSKSRTVGEEKDKQDTLDELKLEFRDVLGLEKAEKYHFPQSSRRSDTRLDKSTSEDILVLPDEAQDSRAENGLSLVRSEPDFEFPKPRRAWLYSFQRRYRRRSIVDATAKSRSSPKVTRGGSSGAAV